MKKKIMASLLVGSAVVGASLAPLSAQAVTTGNTPVTVGVEGGNLPDGNGPSPNTERPDPNATNSDFDLLYIPREYDFGTFSISDDLTKPIPNKTDEGLDGYREAVGVGDLRGTKEGWHVTAQSNGMTLGNERLEGNISSGEIIKFILEYNTTGNRYSTRGSGVDPENQPVIHSPADWTIGLGGDAVLLASASTGYGQGLWHFSMREIMLNITTPAHNIKAGNYTGNITWNLVAGPSI
ncbi:WxL domain-containing protein [Enterococcus faecalis]|uniref:WxL domain-containing protein n=1 Tax=Enterococcus faecalis TaxID=1351 RepID=UPI00044F1401|nr:WxL domain-containing protein [Enterococcus faecalis]EGO2737824.1 WxL domain-containing protein [Enterococcus faecalis]EGO8088417.1 WxL domain-containing protein [Enterococcus faecalis]EGO8234388.1 WxL domain-containing protein [Enterococcus faecalis]EGO8486550.1 WxL domain-containing protein [Enterococcus faecalis]EGO8501089.1 WxL domain-containing protein [Enterococcus faecalis]